jgi:tetratricopeptide (TPR) repeat protein
VWEDQLNYNEPPDWFFSVRHVLGDLYLQVKEYKKAEDVYREDLKTWVKNGYALNGLYHSLEGQGRTEEAMEIKSQFEKAWQYADSKLRFSRIDETQRQNLVLRIDEETPNEMMYIADAFCGFLN